MDSFSLLEEQTALSIIPLLPTEAEGSPAHTPLDAIDPLFHTQAHISLEQSLWYSL